MSPEFLLGSLIVGLVVMTLSACAHQVINEIQWHDLEEYCERKRQKLLFRQILNLRDQMALGTLTSQMIATGIAITCGVLLAMDQRAAGDLGPGATWGITGTAIFSLILFCCWIPWAVAQVVATPFLYSTWRVWWIVSGLAWPLIIGAKVVSAFFVRASGLPMEDDDQEEAIEDEILSIVSEGEHDGHIEPDTADMIEGVMELDDSDVGRVMTPRSRVDSMDIQTGWDEMLYHVVESGRTRIPVFQDNIDNIVGILFAKDILRESLRSESKRRPLKKLLRAPIVVPETTLLDEMLGKFQSQRVHMAIVQDEYGGLAGVVTIEDILEEIVGEIDDEMDDEEVEEIRMINASKAEVVGTTQITRLNEKMGLQLPEDDEFDTVSGLLMHELNEVPRPGREFVFDNVEFRVEQANRRFIERVYVTVLGDHEENGTLRSSET